MARAGWVAGSLAWRGLARCLAGVGLLTGVDWLAFVVLLGTWLAGWGCVTDLLTGRRGVAAGWRGLTGWEAGVSWLAG